MTGPWWTILGVLTAVASAAALYAASRHCSWPVPRRHSRRLGVAGVLLAALSLTAWILALGPPVGTCAMLATWMLALIAWPWLALLTPAPDVDPEGGP